MRPDEAIARNIIDKDHLSTKDIETIEKEKDEKTQKINGKNGSNN